MPLLKSYRAIAKIILISIFPLVGCTNFTNEKPNAKLLMAEHEENGDKNHDFNPADSIRRDMSQHYLHEKTYKHINYTNENQWDEHNDISTTITKKKSYQLLKDYRTFGWHVYSNGSSHKNYNFSLLWGLSYFAYSLDPKTGSYKNIHQWKTTSLIDSAHVNGCKVFLTISNFGGGDNSVFLDNSSAQNVLADSVVALLALRDADGINIDFEGVHAKSKEKFSSFIAMISARLKSVNPDYMISLCLYAIDWNKIFDIKKINPHVDFYTLMGYDYYGSFSKETGPVTPLQNSKVFGRGLESSIDYYLTAGVDPQKLIVGLPYYGAEWFTKSTTLPSNAEKFISNPPYKNIKRNVVDSMKIPIQFENETSSNCVVINYDSKIKQLWFDDKRTLSIKYDWIKSKRLGGVGIWALGYDDGYTELWELMAEKFAKH